MLFFNVLSPNTNWQANWRTTTGAGTCNSCVAGHYNAEISQSSCTQCPSGQYQSQTGASTCNSCSAGTYIVSSGSSACSACVGGQYQSSTGASSCLSCPAGFYCTIGAVTTTTCVSGTFAASGVACGCKRWLTYYLLVQLFPLKVPLHARVVLLVNIIHWPLKVVVLIVFKANIRVQLEVRLAPAVQQALTLPLPQVFARVVMQANTILLSLKARALLALVDNIKVQRVLLHVWHVLRFDYSSTLKSTVGG